ncbi:MAG: hypothetical protein AAB352_01115 [Patescibacteria group bacterium]
MDKQANLKLNNWFPACNAFGVADAGRFFYFSRFTKEVGFSLGGRC